MTLVFGTKLGAESRPVAEVAGLLAKRLNRPLRLVHVAEDMRAPVVLGTDEEYVLGSVREDLEQEARRVARVTGATVQPHLTAGPIVDALVSIAKLNLATALLVGSGPTPSRNPLGGLTDRVSRTSAVPVLTLRAAEALSSWLRGQHTLRILVCADLGRAAESARRFAAEFAKIDRTEVEVVMVASPTEVHKRLGIEEPVAGHQLSPLAEEALTRQLERAAPEEETSAVLRVLPARGGAGAHLVALADQGDFDLMIVGQRRRSAIEQLWYGSVARVVLQAAPMNVACVPPQLASASSVSRTPRTVVVGVDLGELDQRVLAQAIGVTAEGGTVHVAHVVNPADSNLETRREREQAWYELTRLTRGNSGAPVTFEHHVLEGLPVEQLQGLVVKVGADLLVLGAGARPALGRAVRGLVGQTLIEEGQVPVLVVPAPEM